MSTSQLTSPVTAPKPDSAALANEVRPDSLDEGSGDATEKVEYWQMKSGPGTPTWEMAELFYPRQGKWTIEDYLALDTNRLIEFVDGTLEFLEMPGWKHQAIAAYLFLRLHAFVTANRSGHVFFAPLRVRIASEIIREPDVVFLTPERKPVDLTRPPVGADLVIEVISPGARSRERDEVDKRKNYADAGITEYWIVDPENDRITVLGLDGLEYTVLGEYGPGQTAVSKLLPDFTIPVTEALAAE